MDAETYRPFYQIIENKIKSHKYITLGTICSKLKKGIFDIKAEVYTNTGIPFVRISNLKNMGISTDNIIYIPEDENNKNLETFLQKGDIILSKTAIPAASIVQLDCCNTSQDTIAIKLANKNLKNSFVVVFLNCKYGYFQMQRWFTGNIQMHLNLEDCKNIFIPQLSLKFQEKIDKIFWLAFESNEQSQSLYRQAEELLLEAIGLKKFKPSERGTNIKSFKKSFLATGRLDAEYYQPKYDEVEKLIKKNGFVYLEDICSAINYGSVPTSPYTENNEGIPYIKGLNLKSTFIIKDKLDYIVNTEELSDKVFTKEGDIIISQMGTVGDVGVVTKDEVGWIFASFTIRVRLKKNCDYLPRFIGLYIQNIAKEWYLQRNIAQASVRQNTDLPTIKKMYIPKVDITIQQQIVALISESFNLRKKSERLLDEAKNMVEREIEGGNKK